MVPRELSAFPNEETFVQEKEATLLRWNSRLQMDVHILKRSHVYDYVYVVWIWHICGHETFGIQEAFEVRKQIYDWQFAFNIIDCCFT